MGVRQWVCLGHAKLEVEIALRSGTVCWAVKDAEGEKGSG